MSQQISGWGSYYLDYKFLKKIINSLEKGRIADAALFATSVRPEETSDGPQPLLPIDSPGSELQVHKAAFFFRLERELEKINAFYLQKESELRTRLTTLITKKRHLIALANRPVGHNVITRDTPSLVTLLEGAWPQTGGDGSTDAPAQGALHVGAAQAWGVEVGDVEVEEVAQHDDRALAGSQVGEGVERFAHSENLPGHANAISVRREARKGDTHD